MTDLDWENIGLLKEPPPQRRHKYRYSVSLDFYSSGNDVVVDDDFVGLKDPFRALSHLFPPFFSTARKLSFSQTICTLRFRPRFFPTSRRQLSS